MEHVQVPVSSWSWSAWSGLGVVLACFVCGCGNGGVASDATSGADAPSADAPRPDATLSKGQTVWYLYDHEEGTAGTALPNSGDGPELFEYNPPGVFSQSPLPAVGLYGETTHVPTPESGDGEAYLVAHMNDSGDFGTSPFGWDHPLALAAGTTYYLAGRFRFERVGGENIWQDTAAEFADEESSSDKLLEFAGDHTRWIISAGWLDTYSLHCRSLADPCRDTFTFQMGMGKNSGLQCVSSSVYGAFNHNVPPYGDFAPYECDYERWYNVVLGITMHNSLEGRARLWINGTLVSDETGFQTMCDTTASTVDHVYSSGTIAQPAYDAPEHKRQFDAIIFTDAWQVLLDRGYLADPEVTGD